MKEERYRPVTAVGKRIRPDRMFRSDIVNIMHGLCLEHYFSLNSYNISGNVKISLEIMRIRFDLVISSIKRQRLASLFVGARSMTQ